MGGFSIMRLRSLMTLVSRPEMNVIVCCFLFGLWCLCMCVLSDQGGARGVRDDGYVGGWGGGGVISLKNSNLTASSSPYYYFFPSQCLRLHRPRRNRQSDPPTRLSDASPKNTLFLPRCQPPPRHVLYGIPTRRKTCCRGLQTNP